jgi:hypothetical protein
MNDEAVPGVKVVFVPEVDGSPSYGVTDENGEFRLLFSQSRAGAELGTHNVLIENPEPETDDSGKVIGPTPLVKVPEKYRRPGALTADVYTGANEFDFSLEAKP